MMIETNLADPASGPPHSPEQGSVHAVRDARAGPARGPACDRPVPPGGYLWWYLDGLSDDRRAAITVIIFVGSVFSPYYAWSGHRDPENHCAVNVALYGDFGSRWAMTERGRGAVERTASRIQIGPSALRWDGDALVIEVEEWGVPLLRRLRGQIRLTPRVLPTTIFQLDGAGRHSWQPIAPKSRIEVSFDRPGASWQGDAYLDSNFGDEPLEAGFRDWSWSRAHLRESSVVLYESCRRDGSTGSLALQFADDGRVVALEPPPVTRLPASGWRVARATRADPGHAASLRRTLVDAPFYARSVIETRLCGETVDGVHESLLLDRFRSNLVRLMLPFRMPRRGG